MKKKMMSLALALVMCMSLCVPALAAENQETETLPPLVEEGETLVSANGGLLREGDTCRYGHRHPDGYIYQGYERGNTTLEATVMGGMLTVVGMVDGLGLVAGVCALALLPDSVKTLLLTYPDAPGQYIKVIYASPNGSSYWYHIVWSTAGGTYITCTTETFGGN